RTPAGSPTGCRPTRRRSSTSRRCRAGRRCSSPAEALGPGCRRTGGWNEDQQMRADLDLIAGLEQVLLDQLAVDERPVQAALVLEHDADRLAPQRGVTRRHGRAGEDDVVLAVAADGRDAALEREGLLVPQLGPPDERRMGAR